MATENNFPDQLDLSRHRAALWQHYWQHLRLGAGLWACIGLCFTAYVFVLSALTSGNHPGEDIGTFFALGFVCLVLFTIPAALGGLLRQPVLVWLSHHASSRGELLGGSLLLFETLVAVATVLGWCYLGLADSKNLWNSFLVCFFISLPWLVATAWASWCLAGKLAIPARRQ